MIGSALLRRLVAARLPAPVLDVVRRRKLAVWPPVGWGARRIGRRTTPVSRVFGYDRGQPVDRHYIEAFLQPHLSTGIDGRTDLRGATLEIGDDRYVRRYAALSRAGGPPRSAIISTDVLDIRPDNPSATIVADLTHAPDVPAESFDCIVCTQTLLLIFDVRAAIATLHRILRTGGVLLVTIPGISRSCGARDGVGEDCWRFTSTSARRLVEERFGAGRVQVQAYGNVLSGAALLYGVAAQELRPRDLEERDPDYEVIIGVRAVKRSGTRPRAS